MSSGVSCRVPSGCLGSRFSRVRQSSTRVTVVNSSFFHGTWTSVRRQFVPRAKDLGYPIMLVTRSQRSAVSAARCPRRPAAPFILPPGAARRKTDVRRRADKAEVRCQSWCALPCKNRDEKGLWQPARHAWMVKAGRVDPRITPVAAAGKGPPCGPCLPARLLHVHPLRRPRRRRRPRHAPHGGPAAWTARRGRGRRRDRRVRAQSAQLACRRCLHTLHAGHCG